MDKKEERLNQIILATINILSEEGADQLSMRKVAKAANLSLSNLQYYYRDKDLLLIATVEQYFQSCKEEVTHTLNVLKAESTPSIEVFLEKLLNLLLLNGKSNNQTMMFQEIWALSSRNDELKQAVETYYKNYCTWMVDLIAAFSKQPGEVVSLLVPYAEGYTIVGTVLPLNKESVIKLLVKLVLKM
ncbi:AcrR family transcriptional regulator [Pedobacter cryoconitis]|uniref:AcrR family transcriptional regulator n=1 Tax=Pedobacter cryoconitis TaxID=188932 RepID=A0A7W9DL49_9SPHI|nr:TetR/AcrR family transcriptional regulator [Pedobacter cryoconitis]MBB5622853.1 AcrR family transcriptional regulator [Pedobacter cryoconitis]MBB5645093.1 AcrR family transcriptional regulator [Pedobacter cryoconitis]